MATIPRVQLFRNSNIISGRSAAIDTLERKKEYVPDGGLILATYSSDNGVKTLLGIVRNSGSANAELTVIDVEGAAENVQKAIEKAINGLNQEDTAVYGQYVSSVSEANGIITVTRTPLPSFDEKTASGKAITAITQTNGEVSVKFGGVAAANVSVADEGNKITATNVEDALFEIKDSLNEAMRGVSYMIDGKINVLNSNPSFKSQHIIVGVNQNNGIIKSVFLQEQNIASASLLGTTSDTKDNETAFGRIAKEVADRTAAIEALSTSSTVTLESAAGTESGVLKVYTIKQGDREVGKINIPKDLVVTSGSVVKGTWNDGTFTEEESDSGTSTGTALKLVIANQTNPVYINTLDLVKDHTGGNGIAISDTNIISVKIDGVSEEFLTVGENGVKLSGVQAAIDAAAASATTKVEKTGEGSHITVTSSKSNSDSSVTYTISESDIASEAALTAEVNDRQSADTTLQTNIDNVNTALTAHTANTVVHVTQEDKDKWNTPTDLSNYYTKEEVDAKDAAINATIEALSSDTKNKIDAEVSARESGDNTLQGNIDNVNSGLTAHTADTTIHVTQADKDKWNTPTDLSNYYTKTEVDDAIANVDVTGQLQNYYTKTEVDSKDASINATIEAYGQVTSQSLNDLGTRLNDYGHVTSQSLNDLSTKFADYYTKSEVDEAIANVDITGQLQNYYTKAEVDSKDSTIQTALDALSGDTKTKIDAEVAARVSGDNALQTALDALEARIAELETKFLNMENNGLQAGEY